MEKTWVSINGWMNGILFSSGKEGNPATRYRTDEARVHYAKWNKSEKNKHSVISLIRVIKKTDKHQMETKNKKWTHRYREKIGAFHKQGKVEAQNGWRGSKGRNFPLENKNSWEYNACHGDYS